MLPMFEPIHRLMEDLVKLSRYLAKKEPPPSWFRWQLQKDALSLLNIHAVTEDTVACIARKTVESSVSAEPQHPETYIYVDLNNNKVKTKDRLQASGIVWTNFPCTAFDADGMLKGSSASHPIVHKNFLLYKKDH